MRNYASREGCTVVQKCMRQERDGNSLRRIVGRRYRGNLRYEWDRKLVVVAIASRQEEQMAVEE